MTRLMVQLLALSQLFISNVKVCCFSEDLPAAGDDSYAAHVVLCLVRRAFALACRSLLDNLKLLADDIEIRVEVSSLVLQLILAVLGRRLRRLRLVP